MLSRKLLAGVAVFAVTTLMGCGAIAGGAGENEYMNACAACHGETGVGDGNIAQIMDVNVPNLTTLSQQNDGAFPMLNVIQVIDGRTGVRGHGSEQPAWAGGMPIWGDRFEVDAVENVGDNYATELMVRGRVLALANYLESIQK